MRLEAITRIKFTFGLEKRVQVFRQLNNLRICISLG
jgi:hypothetical protein